MYKFSVVYKVYFLRLYSLSAKYVLVCIYGDSRIFSLYITPRSKLCCSEIISVYLRPLNSLFYLFSRLSWPVYMCV